MKNIILITTLLFYTNIQAQTVDSDPVVELPMNQEVVEVPVNDPVVQGVIKEHAPAPTPQASPVAATTKVVTTKQEVTTIPVQASTPPPQTKTIVQQPMVVQPIVVQPVIIEPKRIEAKEAPKVQQTQAPQVPAPTGAEAQVVNPNGNKNVKLKKNKDGSNVYNFNFYNNTKNKKQPNTETTPIVDEEDHVANYTKTHSVLPSIKTKRNLKTGRYEPTARPGSGPQFEVFSRSYSNKNKNDLSAIDKQTGMYLGYRIMHSSSGFYVTPGIVSGNNDTEGGLLSEYNGDSNGFFVRLGKVNDIGRHFSIDFGLEYSRHSGTLTPNTRSSFSSGGFYDESSGGYDFDLDTYAAYFSPTVRWKHFMLAWPISMGVANTDG